MTWTKLLSVFGEHDSFLISSHVSPDGDCIGSQLALCWYLQSLGKAVSIYNYDPVPSKFRFLQGVEQISTERPQSTFDVLVVLDCSNPQRLGWEGHEQIAQSIVNIDHHRDNMQFGSINLVQTSAATGEIIYRFFSENGVEYPPHVAEALYTAIMTDTGGFRFSNTNSSILKTCADLADKGADCARIYRNVYASFTPNAMLLQSRIWSTLEFHLDNRVCTMELPLGLVDQLGASHSDSEGMADMTILGGEVDIGMLVKHDSGHTHFSLRSRDGVDVGAVARQVEGGGGHTNAAGCTMNEPVERALPKMLQIVSRELG